MLDEVVMNVRPWETEPNSLDWEHAGLRCAIRRHPEGLHLCGYVGVPAGHPLFGVGYYDSTPALGGRNPNRVINVHRGLTYAQDRLPDGGGAGLWWFGFDCGHLLTDYIPGYATMGPPFLQDELAYKDMTFVRRETEQLAEQLAAVGQESGSRLFH